MRFSPPTLHTHTHGRTHMCRAYFRIDNSHVNAELVIRILMMGEKRKSRNTKRIKNEKKKKKNQLKLIKNFLLPNYAYKNTKIPARSTKKFCKNKNVLKTLCKLGQISSRFANNLRRETGKKGRTENKSENCGNVRKMR